ncbi:MAG TPA: hypothetical protein VFC09_13165 [Candidatus Dormibacteraeota bacterium]|nr:hypothetical protein [Candidatus Dormibacteraeota bacterium]
MVRSRRAASLLAALAVLPVAALATACGSSSADITTKTTSDVDLSTVRPGDSVPFTVLVTNQGPGQATSVTVRVDLPAQFRYASTTGVDASATTTRTQPSDPAVNSNEPLWGQWTMGAPGINADGTPAHATLTISFTAKAAGSPGDYSVVPHVFSDGNDEVVGKGAALHMQSSSDLTMAIAVDETTVKRGDLVHYHVSVINRGSGPAAGVGILVTLPSGLTFNKTEHLEGNYTRSNPVDPINGALIVYYGGWTLPGSSSARPGALTIVFSAKVLPTALGGRYAVTAQLTDADGAVINLGDTAPVTFNAPTPTPAPPSPTPKPSPTRKP